MSDHNLPKWRIILVPIWVFAILIAMIAFCVTLLYLASERLEIRQVEFERKQFADAVARIEAGQGDHLSLYDIHGMDEKLSSLQPLPGLLVVHLSLTDVTQTGLRSLAKQPNLKELAFSSGRNRLHPAELRAIAEVTQLERLTFDGWCILDEQSLGNLKARPHLKYLEIERSVSHDEPACVTDATLRILSDFGQLRTLKLKGNWFSDAAVSKLREKLPDCQIVTERR